MNIIGSLEEENLPLTLLRSVVQNKDIPRKDFVKILVGNLHKWSSGRKFRLDCYGILDNFKNQDIILEEILKGLIDKELISEEIDGTLRITKRGLNYLNNVKEKEGCVRDHNKDIPKNLSLINKKENKISLSFNNEELYENLRVWRNSVASEKNIPSYCVFQNSTLINLAKQLPKTKEDLNNIKGIGKKKIESYGEEILKIVNEYKRTNTHNEELQEQVEIPGPIEMKIFTVGGLTKYIKDLLESDKKLTNLLVKGEISNLKQHSSGHIYFSLKDKESQIKCLLFKRVVNSLKFNLEHGMKIIIRGNIELYEPQGEYSIIIEEIQPDGLGALNLAFIQLKEKLEKEGLFSREHKKPLPKFPKVIGIITSQTGAVLQDILNIIKRRYPLVKILIVPTVVQGKGAANSIVESIKLMNEFSHVDSIILGRGGGSLEDLWCFNEEIVARAIFGSKIPIISAVGHETDFTIADFVADYRAPTPSAAAEKIVPDIQELYETLHNFHIRDIQAIKYLIEFHRSDLNQILKRSLFKRPFDKIHAHYKEIDHISYKLQTVILNNLSSKRKRLEIIESKISALNPRSILKRGYSIIMKNNKIIKDSSDVKISNNIDIILHKGKLNAQVKKIQKN